MADSELSLERVASSTLKKGLLWTQRDKVFSRWKERYFVLTKDYLNCFKKAEGPAATISEMGDFLYKVKMQDVLEVELIDKRGYLTICISLPKDGKIFLRKTEGIRMWCKQLQDCFDEHKKSSLKNARRSSCVGAASTGKSVAAQFLSRKQITDSASIENWLLKKKGLTNHLSDSTPDIEMDSKRSSVQAKTRITLDELSDLYKEVDNDAAPPQTPVDTEAPAQIGSPVKLRRSSVLTSNSKKPKIINRLSLMTDIELPDFSRNSSQYDLDSDRHSVLLQRARLLGDGQDSGTNSMSTTGSVASSASSSSHSKDSVEEKLSRLAELNLSSHDLKSRRRDRHSLYHASPHQTSPQKYTPASSPMKDTDLLEDERAFLEMRAQRRSSCQPRGLQITHV